jgi:hypothetical protein
MDINSIETLPTIQKVYDLIGQENIMSFYLESVKIGKKYVNPFRDDRHASCFFKWTNKGNLYFVDYATEQVYFSPVDVAQLRTGYGFPEILFKIESDFRINDLSMQELESLRLEEKPPIILDPADIRVTLSYFKTSDFDYWKQFGITPEILELYDVRKVDKAWINGKLWYLKNDFDPCYRYLEKDKIKLYRPLADKKSKFRTNFDDNIMEGFKKLPEKANSLILTKSYKDVMCLKSIGYVAISPRSESTPVTDDFVKYLKEKFNNIYVWFDNDEVGKRCSQTLAEKYDLKLITHNPSLPKDPSDIYKNLGKDALTFLLKDIPL